MKNQLEVSPVALRPGEEVKDQRGCRRLYSTPLTKTSKEAARAKAKQERQAHKDHLASEYGVTGNPKLDLLYEKAWALGHAYGFTEVGNYFADLVELIR